MALRLALQPIRRLRRHPTRKIGFQAFKTAGIFPGRFRLPFRASRHHRCNHRYDLAERGHTVTVVDRQRYPAMETSFANASTVLKGLTWLARSDAPLLINPRPDWHKYSWLADSWQRSRTTRPVPSRQRVAPFRAGATADMLPNLSRAA